ncbi:MAG: cytochrome C oxidase subunit IV family protein [Betaproteobacteria bacterium]|nr:cytochrome C oxidase subunit IV family protein [Betaproteobacteria bacterium]MBU6513480.1 cytochrome C oxidase subunit IV family protein [Betaproteobacteria bacterium]MDE1955829.1 cytochrome C oxidase subunit IV family protein [Betaproteobacteria bacterium]MDE2153872.1 cytochrome C oxidase subunit IV family protein [Betaproteobacteria bacterium]MDE2477690.1 cytochrome C oxidase subunit IV family protein [Betaproteobacteria bacterium]
MSRIPFAESTGAAAGAASCTAAWIALLALSAASWRIGALRATPALAALALAATLLKAQIVIDHFMGLRHARRRWRALLAGWLLLVAAVIGSPLLIH